MSPPLHLRVRSFRFRDVPTYWLDGDPWKTRFMDAFSTMLPVGERFFIDYMRRAAGTLDDPEIDALVRAFAQQEGVHSREHKRYNDRLRAAGYDLDAWDRSQRATMGRILRLQNPRIGLALTVAVEHITAMLGEAALAGDLLTGADPEMKAFWSWHAADEIEHKGAAFEVYERAGGGPDLRRVVMAWALLIVGVRVGARFAHMMRREGHLFEGRAWRSGARFLFGDRGLLRQIAPDFRAFFRRDFKPWQKQNYDLVVAWEKAVGAT